MERSIREACMIAGISPLPSEVPISAPSSKLAERITFLDAAECLARAYARKLSALKGPEISQLEGRKVLIFEMGHVHTTVLIVTPQAGLENVTIDKVTHSTESGSFQFDCALFSYFATQIEGKHKCTIQAGTKKGMRVMRECERLRKLLSQLPTSSVTIENISDSGDVSITMSRDEMACICAEPLQKLRQVINNAIEGMKDEIAAVEIVGGGVRMAMVQELIVSLLGKNLPLGAKLDDGSIAVGAAILANEQSEGLTQVLSEDTPSNEEAKDIPLPDPPSSGLSFENLVAARQFEVAMQVSFHFDLW